MTREARASAEARRIRMVTCAASVNSATHCRLDAFLRQQTVLWKWERSDFLRVFLNHMSPGCRDRTQNGVRLTDG